MSRFVQFCPLRGIAYADGRPDSAAQRLATLGYRGENERVTRVVCHLRSSLWRTRLCDIPVHRGRDGFADGVRSSAHRIIVQVGIASGSGLIGVAEQLADNWESPTAACAMAVSHPHEVSPVPCRLRSPATTYAPTRGRLLRTRSARPLSTIALRPVLLSGKKSIPRSKST